MTLNKKYILITRPIEQADYLSRLILDNDGISVKFPTIDIQPLDKTKELIANFNNIKDSDILIFISRNAVRVAVDRFITDINMFKNIKIIGVGSGTMGELEKSNFKNIIYSEQSDSEGVLNLSDMQSEKIKSKKIFIIRGVGGRELLVKGLKERGADVECIEIYKRCLTKYNKNQLDKLWYKRKPDAAIVTSNDILDNLTNILEDDKKQLLSTPLIVMSDRIAEYARNIGFISKISIVKEKSDDGIFQCLLKLVGD